ncbi:hypothetical protein, partial [Gallintestinimicrobium sp.]|uniref:hypothetical protein n=1 Tax=Gallintestinimicrobium sp. TaxID=2981655 RepID=UPI003AF183AA
SKLSNFILHQFGGLHKLWDTPADKFLLAGKIYIFSIVYLTGSSSHLRQPLFYFIGKCVL